MCLSSMYMRIYIQITPDAVCDIMHHARWDGLAGPDMILEQTYDPKHWEAHWQWMLPFFKHKNYIRVDNKPMLVLYRPHEVPDLSELLTSWRQRAIESGVASVVVLFQVPPS